MSELTQTRDVATYPEEAPPPTPRDPLVRFLRIGAVLLAVMLVGFGVLYFRDQHVTAAPSLVSQQIDAAENAVRTAPNNVSARINLGAMYTEAKRYDEAVAQFDEVLKVDSGNTDARMGKGTALLTKGDLTAAKVEFTKVTEQKRTGEFAGADTRLEAAHYYLGVIANKQGQSLQAVDELGKALAIEPTDSDAMYQVALAQAQLGKHADAVTSLKRALTFVPTGWCEPYTQLQASYTALTQPEQATYAGAMGLFCQGKSSDAKQQLTTLTAGPAGVDAMLGLGLIAQVDKDTQTAVAWYRSVLAKDPKNMTAISYLAALGVAPSAATAASPSATPTK